ncbi:phage tail protein [Burkholderia cenocepacia]|nr:phage tail protein [Burkholderia cenocepacia]
MTTPIFTWVPLVGAKGTAKFSVRTAQFGDGYRQDVADGINNKADSWPLVFTGHSSLISPIKSFLDARQGYQSFYWTPPLRPQGLFKCAQYTVTLVEGDIYTLEASFVEAFN